MTKMFALFSLCGTLKMNPDWHNKNDTGKIQSQ